MLLMTITMPLLWLVCSCVFVIRTCRLNFERALPMVLLAVPTVLYAGQFLFRSFLPGCILLVIPAAVGAVFCIRTKTSEDRGRLIRSPGFLMLLAVWMILAVIDFKRSLVKWDELMHWGTMVKEMLRTDRFYADPAAHMPGHRDYPPFGSLLQLFWCRLCGGYTEMGVSMATHVLTLSLALCPVTEMIFRTREKEDCRETGSPRKAEGFLQMLLLTLCMIVVLLALDPFNVLFTIYQDIPIAAVFAYAVWLVWSGAAGTSRSGFAVFLLALINILGIKQIGISFFCLAVLYFLLTEFQRRPSAAAVFGKLAAVIAVPGLSAFVWSRYTHGFALERQFDLGRLHPSALAGIVRGAVNGTGSGLQRDTLIRFILALFQKNIWNGVLPVTFVSALFLAILTLCVCRYFAGERFPGTQAVFLGLICAAGTCGYAGMMLILYLTCFEEREMVSFISYPRYMGSYFLGIVLALMFVGLDLFREKWSRKMTAGRLTVLFLALAVLLSPAMLLYFVPQKLHGNPRTKYRVCAEKLRTCTETDDSVFILSDELSKEYQYFVQYYANELSICMEDTEAWNYDFAADPALKDRLVQRIGKNDYLYVVKANDGLRQVLSPYSDAGSLEENTVYRVTAENGGIRLTQAAN